MNAVLIPFQLAGPRVAALPQDKHVLVMGSRLVVITADGGVFAHEITGNTVGTPFLLGGPKVAARPQDKRVLLMGNRILVNTTDGAVFAHEITGNAVSVPVQLAGPRVAALPQDKHVLVMGSRLVVITADGGVFAHETSSIGDNYTFDPGITAAQIATLRERHLFGFSRMTVCGNLNAQEKAALQQTFLLAIQHGIETDPNANASGTVGGTQIFVNFGVLFPQGPVEIAQTLVHEMMHCAGFTHPTRRDPPPGMSCAAPNPALFDCPFDNGQYYGTPPLRAELCMAGNQSDLILRAREKAGQESCIIDERGVATIRRA